MLRTSGARELALLLLLVAFLISLLFGADDGRDIFLRGVGISPNYTDFQLRRLHSSQYPCDNLQSEELPSVPCGLPCDPISIAGTHCHIV
jgi:hypothetical protein